MGEYNKLRIEWSCRRGMLELDKVIIPFYQLYFDDLSAAQKVIFERLLDCTDLQLFSWFFNQVTVPDLELREMVAYMKAMLKLST